MSRLENILRPKSIAVIGASRKEGSLGKMFVEAILRMHYTGRIYPINPKADFINDIKVYPSVETLPENPDLAVILLPYQFVLQALDELGKNKIRDVVVISAGFKEVGGEGVEREHQLLEIGKKYNMNILGPIRIFLLMALFHPLCLKPDRWPLFPRAVLLALQFWN